MRDDVREARGPQIHGSSHTNHPFQPDQRHSELLPLAQRSPRVGLLGIGLTPPNASSADQRAALIIRANLTSAGVSDNIELGVLIETDPLPKRLSQHVEPLGQRGVLE